MKPLSLAAAVLLLASALQVQAQTVAGCAQVEVHNVRPQQGSLMLAAYADADSFLKKPELSLRLAAGDAVMQFQICGLTANAVALTLYQDLDSDGKLGRNLMGMPSEPWGSSGAPGAFGPSWEAARVPLDGKTIVVKMSI